MIEALGMAGIIAMLCIPAGMIGRAVDKQIRRRAGEETAPAAGTGRYGGDQRPV